MDRRFFSSTLLALAGGLALPSTALAAEFPTKPITLIVGAAAGSGTDAFARFVGRKLSSRLGQPVIVDNRPGASGMLGARFVRTATPDGYTLLFAPSSLVANVAVFKNPGYDPIEDFLPIARLGKAPFVVAVRAGLNISSVGELVAYARSRPGQTNFGSASGAYQIVNELFVKSTSIRAVHIPYKGTPQLVTDLVSGQIDFAIVDYGVVAPLEKSGRLRILAVTGDRRLALEPNVPTLQETGFPVDILGAWVGIYAPAKIPPEIAKKLTDNLLAVTAESDFHSFLTQFQYENFPGDGTTFAAFTLAEAKAWAKGAEIAGVEKQ